eukprot:1229998-Amphidinium_carterae.1
MARAIEQRNKNSETALAAEACALRTALLQTQDAARTLQGKNHFLRVLRQENREFQRFPSTEKKDREIEKEPSKVR